LNFSSGIVFGVNFNNNGDNAQPRCRNYGPAKETGKLVVNNTTTAENCNNVCNILLEPAPNFTYASCKSMTMTYGGKSVNVSSTTSSNTISPAPQPGESVTLSTVPDKASSKSFFWMRPANAPDDACSFYVLDTSGNSTVTFNMPNWKGGLKRNDTLAGQCAGKPALDFSSGIVFGVNYSDNGDNTKPRCRNFGPSTTNGLLISNNANTGQSCSNICSITAK
jgi:hypothetical protein